MKKIICYSLSLGLFVFYLAVLGNAGKRAVSTEYQLFYVDHELKYYLPDHELEKYTVDQEWNYNISVQSQNIDRSWSHYENDATWMTGEESSFYIWIDSIEEETYWLKLTIAQQVDYERNLYVNGNVVEPFLVDADGVYRVEISADWLKKGLNKFTIATQGVERYCDKSPESTDERELTMFVKSIGLYSRK